MGRPLSVWNEISDRSGSFGPDSPVTLSQFAPACMLARTVALPNGSVAIRSGRMIQRRSAVNSPAFFTAQPTRAGWRFFWAAATASTSLLRRTGP